MRVKMLITEGSLEKGMVYNLSEKQAVDLLTTGKAVRTKETPLLPEEPKTPVKRKKANV